MKWTYVSLGSGPRFIHFLLVAASWLSFREQLSPYPEHMCFRQVKPTFCTQKKTCDHRMGDSIFSSVPLFAISYATHTAIDKGVDPWPKPGSETRCPDMLKSFREMHFFSLWACQTEKMWAASFGTPIFGEESRGKKWSKRNWIWWYSMCVINDF